MNHVEANRLRDVYGELLSPRQQEILTLYYEEDLSLSEIAEELGVSRAAVSDAIRKGTSQLEKFERIVGHLGLEDELREALNEDSESRLRARLQALLT